jgi:hypothetical protein
MKTTEFYMLGSREYNASKDRNLYIVYGVWHMITASKGISKTRRPCLGDEGYPSVS